MNPPAWYQEWKTSFPLNNQMGKGSHSETAYFEQFARALPKLLRETTCCKYMYWFLQICWAPTKALHLSWCKWYPHCVWLYHPPKHQVNAARFEATFTIHHLSRVLSLADMQSCNSRLSSWFLLFLPWSWQLEVASYEFSRWQLDWLHCLQIVDKRWQINSWNCFSACRWICWIFRQ